MDVIGTKLEILKVMVAFTNESYTVGIFYKFIRSQFFTYS